jgi:hypothetical protein
VEHLSMKQSIFEQQFGRAALLASTGKLFAAHTGGELRPVHRSDEEGGPETGATPCS